jgi:hypothetical protein
VIHQHDPASPPTGSPSARTTSGHTRARTILDVRHIRRILIPTRRTGQAELPSRLN